MTQIINFFVLLCQTLFQMFQIQTEMCENFNAFEVVRWITSSQSVWFDLWAFVSSILIKMQIN